MRRAGLLLAAVALLAGCSAVPSGSAAHVVRRVPADGPELPDAPRPIRRVARPPQDGATPADIVRGFLTAQADSEHEFALARLYLAAGAAWDPAARVVVYTSTRLGTPVVRGSTADVPATITRVGTLGRAGEFRPAPSPVAVVRFALRRGARGWRVTNPLPGVLLNTDELAGSYQRATLYFPDQARRLVPDPVFLPTSDRPVAEVVRALLAGPRQWLAPVARTVVPDGTELLDVRDADGIATVNFSRELRRAPQETLGALVAQLVWTLTEPPLGVQAVRIEAEGEPLVVPDHGRDHRRADWAAWAPAPDTFDRRLFFVRAGQPYAVDQTARAVRLRRTPTLESFAVNRAGTLLAGVTPVARGRQSLVVVDLGGRTAPRTAVTATALTPPAWEPDGTTVWTVTTNASGQQVAAVPARGGAVATVALPVNERVRALRLSADGARAVLVAGPATKARLLVARVERTASGGRVLAEPRPVAPALAGVTAVAFDGLTQLVVATYSSGRPALYRVDVDGYLLVRVRDAGLPARAVTACTTSGVTLGPTAIDRVVSAAGRLWRRTPGADWAALPGPATAGTYAG